MTTVENATVGFTDQWPNNNGGGNAFNRVVWLLSGNLTNITEFSNFTSYLTRSNDQGVLPRWEIILIVCLISAAVVSVVVMVLIWKLCGKKSDQTAPSTVSPMQKAINGMGLCGRKHRTSADGGDIQKPSVSKNQPQPQGEYQREPDGPGKLAESKWPLPPIGVNASLQRVGPVPPRRLAPLTPAGAVTVSGIPKKTGGAYGPLQLSGTMRGVPVIPVPLEQRRPLPPPPIHS